MALNSCIQGAKVGRKALEKNEMSAYMYMHAVMFTDLQPKKKKKKQQLMDWA